MKLWKHQEEAVRICRERNFFAFLFDMGTGKTRTALEVLLEKMSKEGEVFPTLILVPKIVTIQWFRELQALGHENVTKATTILEDSGKNKAKQLEDSTKKVFITNHESLALEPTKSALLAKPWRALIVDESHRFKNPVKRTATAIKIADKCEFVFLLTGTLVTNTYQDVWGQWRILHRGLVPDSHFSFRHRFFIDKNSNMPRARYFPNWVVRDDRLPELSQLIADHSMRVKKEDVLTLPPLIRTKVYVELTKDQRAHYDRMERDFITFLGDDACVAEMALTRLLRLMQLASGIFKLDGGEVRTVDVAKLEALRELVSQICLEAKEKVIIWSFWRATYGQLSSLCNELGLKFSMITGEQSMKDRQANIDSFNNDPETSVCIANQAAAGVGVNLQAAKYMIYYTKGFSLEHDLQSEARAYRAGNKNPSITRIDIVTANTVEETVLEALEKKFETSELLHRIRGKNEPTKRSTRHSKTN